MEKGGPRTQGQSLRSNGMSNLVQIQTPKVAIGPISRVPRDSYSRLWSLKALGSRGHSVGFTHTSPSQVDSYLLDRALSLILLL